MRFTADVFFNIYPNISIFHPQQIHKSSLICRDGILDTVGVHREKRGFETDLRERLWTVLTEHGHHHVQNDLSLQGTRSRLRRFLINVTSDQFYFFSPETYLGQVCRCALNEDILCFEADFWMVPCKSSEFYH